MGRINSFPPVEKSNARILILGSMPGEASLAAHQYYAHPRNLFWRIMGELTGAGPELPYDQRMDILQAREIALWDVLQSCVREGSLDSAIQAEIPNNFAAFFQSHPRLTHVFFNGKKAQDSFQKHVDVPAHLSLTTLPSTSPAHAALSFEQKHQAWSKILSV